MISAIVNTCNEEKYLQRCLDHLKWADEIVIVDMHSEDRSVEIAQQYTDKIFFHERTISVLYARDFSLTKARGDWVLIVDPDEVISEGLAEKLREIEKEDPIFSAVRFPARMVYFGKELRYSYPVQMKVRFFRKGCVSFPKRVHGHPIVKGETLNLPEEDRYMMIHYGGDSFLALVKKIERYTSDEALHMHKDEGITFSILNVIKKPIAEFFYRYIKNKGYKDGRAGFLYCCLMAVYRFKTYMKLRTVTTHG